MCDDEEDDVHGDGLFMRFYSTLPAPLAGPGCSALFMSRLGRIEEPIHVHEPVTSGASALERLAKEPTRPLIGVRCAETEQRLIESCRAGLRMVPGTEQVELALYFMGSHGCIERSARLSLSDAMASHTLSMSPCYAHRGPAMSECHVYGTHITWV